MTQAGMVAGMPMNERSGTALLKRRFEAAGLQIAENVPFDEGGVRFQVDGWDAARRVGYEYVTTEAGDREELPPEVLAALDERMARGELCLLIVDELDAPEEGLLERAASGFLDELVERGVIPPIRTSGASGAKGEQP